MGIISVERADSLLWLGRYTERVFTTIKVFFEYYDGMLDANEMMYKRYCQAMAIPDIYKDRDDFTIRYVVDESNPDSILSNLKRAYDNAIVSRDDVSTESMAYLELCLQEMRKAIDSPSPLLELQSIMDYIYAFWGSIDDCIEDEENRNIVKSGRYMERMDIYLRLKYNYPKVEKEFRKFKNRISKVKIGVDQDKYEKLQGMMERPEEYEALQPVMLSVLQQIFI